MMRLGIVLLAVVACSKSEPVSRPQVAEPAAPTAASPIDAPPIDAPPIVQMPGTPDAMPDSGDDSFAELLVGSGEGTYEGSMERRSGPDGPPVPVRDVPVSERKARISLMSKEKLDTQSTLDVDTMLATVQRRGLAGIKRCYLPYAKQHPDERPMLTLQLVVDARGHATDVDAAGLDAKSEACTETEMRRWRFAQPKTATGTPAEARFKLELRLLFD